MHDFTYKTQIVADSSIIIIKKDHIWNLKLHILPFSDNVGGSFAITAMSSNFSERWKLFWKLENDRSHSNFIIEYH